MQPGDRFQYKKPWFPLYVADFLLGTSCMAPAAKGIYITLLCAQWDDPTCTLPADQKQLARLSGCNRSWSVHAQTVLSKLHFLSDQSGDRVYNRRLWEERVKSEQVSISASKSASKRHANAQRTQSDGSASHSHSHSHKDQGQDHGATAPGKFLMNGKNEPLEFPVKGSSKGWRLPLSKVEEWREEYPALDVEREIRRARQWLLDNPDRQKTSRGMTRFLGSWLARASDKSKTEEAYGFGRNMEGDLG